MVSKKTIFFTYNNVNFMILCNHSDCSCNFCNDIDNFQGTVLVVDGDEQMLAASIYMAMNNTHIN